MEQTDTKQMTLCLSAGGTRLCLSSGGVHAMMGVHGADAGGV